MIAVTAEAKYGGETVTPDDLETFKYVYDIQSTSTNSMVTFTITVSPKEPLSSDINQVNGTITISNAEKSLFWGQIQKDIVNEKLVFEFTLSHDIVESAQFVVGYRNEGQKIKSGYLDRIELKNFEQIK